MLILGLFLTNVGAGHALPLAHALPSDPGFADGGWLVTMVSSGPIEVGTADARVGVTGSGTLHVLNGVITGDYSFSGSDFVTAGDGYGSATMTSYGQWTGTAEDLGMIDGNSTIEGVAVVDGVSRDFSFTFPSSGVVTQIPIIAASCDLVVADWTYVTNSAFAGTGATPHLIGSFVAIRLPNEAFGEEPLANQYLEQALAIHQDGLIFTVNAETTGVVDPVEFNNLMTRVEEMYNALERSAACGYGDADGWIGLLAGLVHDMLRALVENPGLFDNMDMLRLVSAGVRMGLFGEGRTYGESMGEVEARLLLELLPRAVRAAEEGDCDGGIALLTVGTLLGVGEIVADISEFVVIACGG